MPEERPPADVEFWYEIRENPLSPAEPDLSLCIRREGSPEYRAVVMTYQQGLELVRRLDEELRRWKPAKLAQRDRAAPWRRRPGRG